MKLEIYNPKGELVNTITDKDSCVARLIEMLWAKSEKIEKVKMTSTMIEGEEIATFTEHFSNGYKYVLSGVPMNHGYINATKIVNSNNFSLACGSKSNFDMDNPLDEYWGLLIEYGIATEDELQLITSINGYSEETLDDVLYARTGYRSWEQYCEANDIENEEDDDENFSIKKGTKKQYEEYLNEIGEGLSEEEFIIGGKMRNGKYGTMLKKYDPIAFNVGYNEWKQNQFSIIDDTKDVLRATGKLAGNIVKNTTDKGGLLMF